MTVNVGSGGANQTWDLTALPTDGDLFARGFVSPASTPYANDFPTSNIAFRSSYDSDSSEVIGYQFWFVDNTSFTEIGDAFEFGDTTFVETSTDPFVISLPLEMGSTWTDVSVDSSSFGAITFFSRDSTITVVDGWGTVTIGLGSFGALRMLAEDYYISQTYNSGVLVSADTTHELTYDWITKDHFIVASIGSTEGETDLNFTQADFVQVLTAITTAVESVDRLNPEGLLSVYPNPFSSSTNIEISESERGSDLAIYDLLGRRIRTLPMVASGESQTVSWDGRSDSGSSVGHGVYFVRIRSGNRIETAKVVLAR